MFRTKKGPSQVPLKQKDEDLAPISVPGVAKEQDLEPIVPVNPNVKKTE